MPSGLHENGPLVGNTTASHGDGRAMGPAISGQPGPRLRSVLAHGFVVFSLYVATAVGVTIHRGAPESTHTTFKILRQSFWHLLRSTNLYAHYPVEQGAAAVDRFKYSPTAAALFMPIAVPPYWPAMLGWSLLNGLALCYALERLLGRQRARVAQWLLLPEAFATMEAMQSNALITALIIAGFVAMESRHQVRAATAIVVAARKVYPAGTLVFCMFRPRRLRFRAVTFVTSLAALPLPLLVTSPAMLMQQYRWWYATEAHDEQDHAFGGSFMKLTRELLHVDWPNLPLQVCATLVLLAPLVARRKRWRETEYRLTALASVLAYAVLFNHLAERASFVIGVTGVVIWYVTTQPNCLRSGLTLLCVAGFRTTPLFGYWLLMQQDFWRPAGAAAVSRRPSAAADPGKPGLQAPDIPGSGPPGWDPAMDQAPTRGT